MSSETIDVGLDQELSDRRGTRVNALPSTIGERVAALRYRLERVDLDHCDGFATEASPLETGRPVETKAVRVTHNGGRTGRLSVLASSHDRLVDEGGIYVVVLYAERSVGGVDRIIALDVALVSTEEIGGYLRDVRGYQKIRWDLLGVGDDVDVERWSP